MHLPTTFHLLPLILLSFPQIHCAIQQPPLSTVTLYHSPSSATSTPTQPKPLAILAYLPSRPYASKLLSFTPPANATGPDADNAFTQIILYLPQRSETEYRSSVTATNGFYAPARGRFRLNVAHDGRVLGVSWRSWIPRQNEEGEVMKKNTREGNGDFDLVMQRVLPGVVFDKPKGQAKQAGVGMPAEEEVVEEKTIFQKYWWVLVAVALLAMTGGGGDK